MRVKTVNILLYAYNNGAAVNRLSLCCGLHRGMLLRRLSCAVCAACAQYSHCQKRHEK